MYIQPFDVNCSQRSGRTQVLAGAAADANLFIYRRNSKRLWVISIQGYHLDCSYRTVLCTVTASDRVGYYDAPLVVGNSVTNLNRTFLLNADWTNRAGRTHL